MNNLHTSPLVRPETSNVKSTTASMRAGFGEGLVLAGRHDKDIVALCADLTESTGLLAFKKEFPDRFLEVGVAEQNLVTVASGMASMGKIPFVASYAVFSPGRNWEQIRTTICYNNQSVKIVGSHTGVTVGPDGGSHQALEDIALMRVLPRMNVIVPCDALEARKVAIEVSKTDSPTYIRLARDKTPILTRDHDEFKIGKSSVLFSSVPIGKKPDVAIIGCGPILSRAIDTAKMLQSAGKTSVVINMSTIKPIDEDAVVRVAYDAGAIVTVEDHQVAGGLGSAIAELTSRKHPVPIEMIGVNDLFGQSGEPAELINEYHLDTDSILQACKKILIRKK